MYGLKIKWDVRRRRGNSTFQEKEKKTQHLIFRIQKHPMAKVAAIQEEAQEGCGRLCETVEMCLLRKHTWLFILSPM